MTQPYADPRDRAHAESLPADERAVVLATVERFRRPDRLAVGDPLPDLELLRLGSDNRLALASLVNGRPLVLVFGSFT